MRNLIFFYLFMMIPQVFAQGLDDSIEETIRSLEKVPSPDFKRFHFQVDYEDRDKNFSPYSDQETAYRNSTEYVLFSVYVRSKWARVQNTTQFQVGRGSDDIKWGKKIWEEKQKFEQRQTGLTLTQRIFHWTISEGGFVQSFENETSGTPKQSFKGRHAQIDYRSTTRSLFPPEIGFHVGGAYDQRFRRVLELGNSEFKDVETTVGRIDIVAPVWFFESVYQDQEIEGRSYRSTQQTIGLRWTPNGSACLSDGQGSWLSNPSGQVFSQHSWMLILGLQKIDEDLNAKDLLGVLLSARLYSPYGDNTKGTCEITLFWPIEKRGFLLKSIIRGGLRDFLADGSYEDENKWAAFEIFVDDLYGEQGGQSNFGYALNLELDW